MIEARRAEKQLRRGFYLSSLFIPIFSLSSCNISQKARSSIAFKMIVSLAKTNTVSLHTVNSESHFFLLRNRLLKIQ